MKVFLGGRYDLGPGTEMENRVLQKWWACLQNVNLSIPSLGTNISLSKALFEDDVLFSQGWDMLVPWRVFFREFGETVNDSVVSCDFIQFGLKVFYIFKTIAFINIKHWTRWGFQKIIVIFALAWGDDPILTIPTSSKYVLRRSFGRVWGSNYFPTRCLDA